MTSSLARPGRCLITGASGFIGRRLCARFDEAGMQPYVALLRSASTAAAWPAHRIAPKVADLLDAPRLDQALQGCDAVVHLAHGDHGPQATRNLVKAATAAGVKRFVYISTMSVHGPVPGTEAAREETAIIGRYNHEYSDSKAEQEEIVQASHDRGDLAVVILRPTVVYGLGGHFELQVIDQALSGVVTMFDGGTGICNAVFVDDVCDAIAAALWRPEALGQAMFINADQPITWGEFIRTFAAMVQPQPRFDDLDAAAALAWWRAHPPLVVTGLTDRIRLKLKRLAGWRPPVSPWPPEGRVLRETFPVAFTNDKAKRLLGWAPQVDFARGVALTHDWLRNQGRLGVHA
ncbi:MULTISPECIES: NAD(P)-dependent oxidoreductase [unclassified Roseateles]|uniref:NAD-dependent epimerase/dehydratase family protein n=1 Tax=unclassified Roseateles TaxID=2626991 RepID=UPI0009E7FD62|nr:MULTISPECIES: NAD-dependent epimerase/dehydratase family protein [unclassified Roseateles]